VGLRSEHPQHPIQLLFVSVLSNDRSPQSPSSRFIESLHRVTHRLSQRGSTVQVSDAKARRHWPHLSEFAGLALRGLDHQHRVVVRRLPGVLDHRLLTVERELCRSCA
jgi:hypothetical protein